MITHYCCKELSNSSRLRQFPLLQNRGW